MRVLAGTHSDVRGVVGHVVEGSSHQQGACGGGTGVSQEGEADEGLRQEGDDLFLLAVSQW